MIHMRLRTLSVLFCALLFAWPAAAQEQRGVIQGVVKDSSGAVIPGANVEAKSATGAALSTTTDAAGAFRFPSLQPGLYDLAATLSGFKEGKISNVHVALGEIRTVDFTLPLATLATTVDVTAVSPVIDLRQSQRAVNIHAEQLALLPTTSRDFTAFVLQAPGANQENKLGGLSIDGASAAENRYIVDGMETTNLQNGLSGKAVITDFIEEVQVRSSGYTAEYGGATGGVINAVTKSGTNDWHGYGLINWLGDRTEGQRNQSLRLDLNTASTAEYVRFPEDSYNRVEPGIAIGGPIAKNKAWFFGAYQPALTSRTRTVTPGPLVPAAFTTALTKTQDTQVQYVTANQTAQISDNVRSRVAFNNSWSKTKGLLPALSGTDAAGTNYSKTSAFPNYSLSANADWVASPRLFVGLRGGYYNSDQHDSNVTEEPFFRWTNTSNIGMAGVPANLQHPAGFSSIASNNKVDRDQQTRANLQADATWYANAGGQHQFKFGVQLDRIGNDVLSGESRNRVSIFWDRPLPSGRPVTRGPFGYYSVRSNGVEPKKGFVTQGAIHSNDIGLFAQDAWTIGKRLTINAGLRTERERVPTYSTAADPNCDPQTNPDCIPKFGVKFNFADKVAPRAGFAYDVKGDGKTKVFGSWGIFYDIFKLELPRGSFGGDKWLEYYYTLDTGDWTTLVNAANCPPACSGTLIRGPIDFRHPSFGSDSIEPNLKPMRSQEATFGLDHEFARRMALNIHYVHKQLDRAIDDTGSLDAQGNEIYIIANPGEGLTALAFTNPKVAMPLPVRDYDSIEFAIEKRLSNNWFLRSSYLWSRLYGNYTGLSQSDENGRVSPNVGRQYDYPAMMFMGNGQAAYGLLPTDRPSQFKTQFIYVFPVGTSIGLNEYVASGIPVTRELGILPGSNYPTQYRGRLSDGRTDMYSQTDLYVQHEVKMGARRFQVFANVQNLFDQRTGISKHSTLQRVNGITFDEADFYAGKLNFDTLVQQQHVEIDPRFLMVNDYQAPILARFGVKFLF
jgi:hypothetical protein